MTPRDLRELRGLLREHGIEDGLVTAWRLWLVYMGQRSNTTRVDPFAGLESKTNDGWDHR